MLFLFSVCSGKTMKWGTSFGDSLTKENCVMFLQNATEKFRADQRPRVGQKGNFRIQKEAGLYEKQQKDRLTAAVNIGQRPK